MSEQIQQDIDQSINIDLSAFIDAEHSEHEISQIIDSLLSSPEYKEQYARKKLANDYLQEQVQEGIPLIGLRGNISKVLDDLPAHFSDEAVNLNVLETVNISQNSWFKSLLKKSYDNKIISGVSVAASVMLVTLVTLQGLNNNQAGSFDSNVVASSDEKLSTSPMLQSSLSPSFVTPVSTFSNLSTTSNLDINTMNKEQYQWIEADPVLSKQVREYISQHEKRQAGYNLQPKIRTATYQVGE
ncbi:MAG: hypothetical protein OQL19_12510 [Gammaproteobacteria bacterium]|nr:hypothetical protein [Gammaproteobacteria bacterium]